MNVRRIETERLILRPIQIDDGQDVFEWAGDQEVNKFMPYPLHNSVSQAEEWIRSLGKDKNEFVFCLKDSGEVIGGISMSYHDEYEAYELGYNMKRKYTQQEVENIVSDALTQQSEEFERQREKEDIWEAINDLQEKVNKLIKDSTKVGF